MGPLMIVMALLGIAVGILFCWLTFSYFGGN